MGPFAKTTGLLAGSNMILEALGEIRDSLTEGQPRPSDGSSKAQERRIACLIKVVLELGQPLLGVRMGQGVFA